MGAEKRLREIDDEVPLDYVEQKEFLQAAVIALLIFFEYSCGPWMPLFKTVDYEKTDV